MASRATQTTSIKIATRDTNYNLTTGSIHAHLVTADPGSSASTGASLTHAAGGSYAPITCTCDTPANDGTGTSYKLTVTSITWTALYTTAATPITGVAFTKPPSGSTYTSTDAFVSYIELTPGSYTPLTSVGEDFRFNVPSTGILKLQP